MPPTRVVLVAVVLSGACVRTAPTDAPAARAGPVHGVASGEASTDTGEPTHAVAAVVDAAPEGPPPLPKPDGPHQLTLEPGRPVYYALPGGTPPPPQPWRLVAHIHGICGPPVYACGKWIAAGAEVGALVCPTGNARCGDPSMGPASWEAPSWGELVADMDGDLERSIALVQKKHPHAVRREGAILTGYSRGGFAVPFIAAKHPGRWPYLLVIEADATFTTPGLRRAGVRRLALVAGELGTEIAGMQKTVDALVADGFPAQLFVMPKTGHLYSDNMEEVMRAALGFLVADGNDASP